MLRKGLGVANKNSTDEGSKSTCYYTQQCKWNPIIFKGFYFNEKSKSKEKAVAIKVISLKDISSEEELEKLRKSTGNEINVFNRINFKVNAHPNLLAIHDVYGTRNNIYIVMELCEKD